MADYARFYEVGKRTPTTLVIHPSLLEDLKRLGETLGCLVTKEGEVHPMAQTDTAPVVPTALETFTKEIDAILVDWQDTETFEADEALFDRLETAYHVYKRTRDNDDKVQALVAKLQTWKAVKAKILVGDLSQTLRDLDRLGLTVRASVEDATLNEHSLLSFRLVDFEVVRHGAS